MLHSRFAAFLFLITLPFLGFAEKIVTESTASSTAGASASTSASVTALSATGTDSGSSVSTTSGVSASPSNPWQPPQDVSYAGSFSYSYPIRLPSGTNGLAPSLALNYNSASPNDILGMGFSLSGLSTITRDPSFPVNFSSADHNLLDGQKLVFRAADSTFHTEKESFDRIQLYWTSTGTTVQSDPNNAGAYWVIQKKDGTVLTFGDPTSGTVNATIPAIGKTTPRLWALSKVADANGNFYTISYTYDAATGAYYPLRMVYTQGNGLTTFKTVQFSYETRTDHAPMYIPTKVDLSQRLKWITVLMGTDAAGNGGSLVRKYRLDYLSVGLSPSRVSAVQEYGADGTAALPKVEVGWQTGANGLPWSSSFSTGAAAIDPNKLSFADVDGDGKTDMIYIKSGVVFIDFGDENGYTNWTANPGNGYGGWDWSSQFRQVSDTAQVLFADVNGDGRADMICNQNGGVIYVNLSKGRFYSVSAQNPNNGYGGWDWSSQSRQVSDTAQLWFADVNGDGRADMICNQNGGVIYVDLSNGTGYTVSAQNANNGYQGWDWSSQVRQVADTTPLWFVDVNGDGRADMVYNQPGYGIIYVDLSDGTGFGSWDWNSQIRQVGDSAQVWFSDVNGDGKADMICKQNGGIIYINFSTGSGYSLLTQSPNNGYQGWDWSSQVRHVNDTAQLWFSDINGDGKADMICNQGGGILYVDLSRGNGYPVSAENPNNGYLGWDWSSQIQQVSDTALIWFVDVQGDGKSDIIYKHGQSDGLLFIGKSLYPSNLLTQITLPTGGTITAAYTPAPQVAGAVVPANSNYLTGVANASPRALVTTVTAYDGISHANDVVTTYQYSNGLKIPGPADVRTELGFEKVTKTTNGTATVSTFLQTKPLQGLTESVTVQDTAATPLVYAKSENSYTATEVIAGQVFFTPLTQTFSKQFDVQTTPVQRKKTFEYDAFGNLTRSTDWGIVNAAGNSVDAAGNQSDQAQVIEDSTWVSNAANLFRRTSKTVTAKDANGLSALVSQTKTYYDSLSFGAVGTSGLATKTEDSIDASATAVTTRTYDAYGNVLTVSDPRVNAGEYTGATQTLTYAAPYQDAVKTSTNALAQTTTYNYDAFGQPTSMVDPNGQTSSMSYDVFGRKAKTVAPLDDLANPTTVTEYSDVVTPLAFPSWVKSKQKTSETSTLDTYTYFDGLGRTIQTKRPALGGWIIQDWFYDASGRNNVVSVPYFVSGSSAAFTTRDTTKKATSFTFDPLSRITGTAHPDTTTSRTIYSQTRTTFVDENGHSRDSVDTGNVVTQHTYDGVYPSQNLTGTTTTRQYAGLSTITDNAGNVTRTFTDRMGRRVRYENPDLGGSSAPWLYSYDTAGNLKTQTDALGHTLSFTYDKLNRLLTRSAVGDATVSVTAVYDEPTGHGVAPLGRLTTLTYHRGSDGFSYDARGRISAQTRTLDGIAKTQSFTYDSMDRKLTETYPTNEVVLSTYNADGNLVSLTGILGGVITKYVTAVTYTDLGKVKTLTYGKGTDTGNGVVTTYNYYDDNTVDPFTGKDHSYRLRQILAGAGNTVMNLSYSYEKNDNVHSRTDGNTPAYNETYGYDAQNRLVSAVSGTSGSGPYGSLGYTYDPLNNLVSQSVNGLNYTMSYQLSRPHAVSQFNADSYTYDANGNMITGAAGRTIAYDFENRVTTVSDGGSYAYDAGRQRTIKTEGTKTHYSFFNNYEEEYTSGVLTNATSYYSANNQKVAQSSTAQGLLYIHADHLGSSTRMTTPAGALVRTQGYKPYGNDSYVTGTATTKYQFTGQEKDSEGLYYYNARYYDPALGRFVQPDPALWSGEVSAGLTIDEQTNAYLYALNNPVVYTDPTGLETRVFSLPVIGDFRHMFIAVKSSDGQVHTYSLYPQNGMAGGITVIPLINGGTPVLRKDYNDSLARELDTAKLAFAGKELPDGYKQEAVVTRPDGMTQDEFDAGVAKQAGRYPVEGRPYDATPGPNSNTYVQTVINNAGGDLPPVKGAEGQYWQRPSPQQQIQQANFWTKVLTTITSWFGGGKSDK